MYLAIAAESSTARILPALIATAPGRASPEERPVHTTPCVMTVSAVFPPQATRQTSIPTAATVRVMASLLISAAWRRGKRLAEVGQLKRGSGVGCVGQGRGRVAGGQDLLDDEPFDDCDVERAHRHSATQLDDRAERRVGPQDEKQVFLPLGCDDTGGAIATRGRQQRHGI